MGITGHRLRLCLVTDPVLCADLGVAETVNAAVAGGVTMVQLRDKAATTRDRVHLARAIKDALAGTGVPIVINDDVSAAIEADVDGVHVGQDDTPAAEARVRLGPDKIVGLSCESVTDVERADASILDYLGIGTVFATATKNDHKPAIGLEGLKELCARSQLPTLAIGGIKAEHTRDIRASGATGLAVVSAICGQPDPKASAELFFQSGLEEAA